MRSSKFCKSLFRNSCALLTAAAILVIAPAVAHAATLFTYDFTLTSANPTYSGTGEVVLSLAAAPGNTAQTQYGVTSHAPVVAGLVSLVFVVDGQTFRLSDAQTNQASVIFQFDTVSLGTIRDITFSETNATGNSFSSTSAYTFTLAGNKGSGSGTFSGAHLVANASPTPEPSSIALLGTGLFAGAGGLFRRYKLNRS